MPDASTMPARINVWGGPGSGWNDVTILNEIRTTRFIRADIAEQREQVLAEALRRIADPKNIHFAGDAQVVARTALSAWEASNA